MTKFLAGFFVLILFLIPSFSLLAFGKKTHSKHVHGEAEVQIGFEDKQGVIYFQTPSEAVVGFEHRGKNEAQKKQYAEGIKALEDNSKKMVILPSGCSFDKVDLKGISDSEPDSRHSDFILEYSINCIESVKGKMLGLNFQKFYPRIKKVNVEVTAPSGEKKLTIRAPSEVAL